MKQFPLGCVSLLLATLLPSVTTASHGRATREVSPSVSLWVKADSDWPLQALALRSHLNTVHMDGVMIGCGLAYAPGAFHMVEAPQRYRNGRMEICHKVVQDVSSLGLIPWLWQSAGSFNASMDAFRLMAKDHMPELIAATADACKRYGFKGINLDWELGPADRNPEDRELMLRFLHKARAVLRESGCKLSLFTGEGVHQLNRVQAEYLPFADEVQSGDLYRGTSIEDWHTKLDNALAVVPQHMLRPGFCCNGCKEAWSATNASVTERLTTLARDAPNVSKVAIWILGHSGIGGEECPTSFYWTELAGFAPPKGKAAAWQPGTITV